MSRTKKSNVTYFKGGKLINTYHAASRMKKRAGCKTKHAKRRFMSDIGMNYIDLGMIPKIEQFEPIRKYMAYTNYLTKKRNAYTRVWLYKSYLAVVSSEDVIITVLKVPEKYQHAWQEINDYKYERGKESKKKQSQDIRIISYKEGLCHDESRRHL